MSYQLEFCKKCVNKSFSSSEGVVCGLTSKKPTFLSTCPDFVKDVKEERKIAERKAAAESDYVDENGNSTSGWSIAWSAIVFIIVVIRIVIRCANN